MDGSEKDLSSNETTPNEQRELLTQARAIWGDYNDTMKNYEQWCRMYEMQLMRINQEKSQLNAKAQHLEIQLQGAKTELDKYAQNRAIMADHIRVLERKLKALQRSTEKAVRQSIEDKRALAKKTKDVSTLMSVSVHLQNELDDHLPLSQSVMSPTRGQLHQLKEAQKEASKNPKKRELESDEKTAWDEVVAAYLDFEQNPDAKVFQQAVHAALFAESASAAC